GLALPPSNQDFDPGDEFPEVKRFAKIVVGSVVKNLNQSLFVVSSREDKHGEGAPAAAKVLQNASTVHSGQHQVENDDVIRIGLRHMKPFGAVRSVIDSVAGTLPQALANVSSQPFLVLDNQHSHFKCQINKD